MTETPGAPGSSSTTTSTRRSAWTELVVLVVLSLLVVAVVKHFVVQAFYIPSTSMEPTLQVGDRILVEKWSDAPVRRGDVVVFDDPGGWLSPEESPGAVNPLLRGLQAVGLYPSTGHLVKRVIGVGGDRVTCCDVVGRLSVDGVVLDETYVPAGEPPSRIDFDVEVPEGKLWVMGDNRSASADSRVHLGDPGGGMVPAEDVVGPVWRVVWPLDRWGGLPPTTVFDRVPSP